MIAKDGEQWANLCDDHKAKFDNAVTGDAKAILSTWVKAQGGAKATGAFRFRPEQFPNIVLSGVMPKPHPVKHAPGSVAQKIERFLRRIKVASLVEIVRAIHIPTDATRPNLARLISEGTVVKTGVRGKYRYRMAKSP